MRHVLLGATVGGEAEETGYRGHRHLSGKLLVTLSPPWHLVPF
jgi:hypothetical protein